MPAPMTWASCASTAARGGARPRPAAARNASRCCRCGSRPAPAPGSRRPGPGAAAADRGRLISTIRPSRCAPRRITASAVTMRALLRTSFVAHAAALKGSISKIRSHTCCADLGVVEDADDRRARRLPLQDQLRHDRAVGGVERRGRLVQQQDRHLGDEAARDVDALLLAAGEGRRRQAPQPLRHIEPRQHRCRPAARASSSSMPRARSGSATMSSAGTRGMTRRNWLT